MQDALKVADSKDADEFASRLCDAAFASQKGTNFMRKKDKIEEKKLQQQIRSCKNRDDRLEKVKEHWQFRREVSRRNWNKKFKDWSEGKWGWKPCFRRYSSQPVQELRESPCSIPAVSPESWSDIVLPYYNQLFDDDNDKILKFKAKMRDLRNERARLFLRGLDRNEFVEKRFTGAMLTNAISKLLAGKASGGDHVQGEFLQRLGERERETLLAIYNERLGGGPKPAAWETPTAILLQKFHGASWIKDFRPITISSVLARVYDRMLLEFLEPSCQDWIMNQFGNRKTYQCSEAVHSLRRVFEKQWLFRRNCSCAKLDVEKAFDSTSHESIIASLQSQQVPEWLIVAIMAEYEDTNMKVVVDGRDMGVVPLRRGVRQGSPLSAMLFQLTLDYTMKEVVKKWEQAGFGINVHWREAECASNYSECFSQLLNNLCFADDQTLITENPEDLKEMIDDVCAAIARAGLKLSLTKMQMEVKCGHRG